MPLLNNPNMPPSDPRSDQGIRLRRYATGLLGVMAVGLAGSTWATYNLHPGWSWVQAFTEAALVGGLADWFAVTALFRHPMGLPIPHTAIIPKSKDRIGDALATFLQSNFLTPVNVARRMDGFDAANALVNVLERPANNGRIRQGLVRLVGQLSETPAAAALMQKLQSGATNKLNQTEVAPLLGRVLAAMLADGRHRHMIDALILWAGRTLDSQEGLIRNMVEERTSWVLRLVSVDERIANELVNGLRGLLDDLNADPDHPVRLKAEQALGNLAHDLQHDPETRAKVEKLKSDLLSNPAVSNWLEGLWEQAKNALKAMLAGTGSSSMSGFGATIAQSLREDAALSGAINQLSRRAVVGLVADHGGSLVKLVSDTVKGWDAATITEKMENAVLKDLQYIRLNGTLIGGLIGLVLHAVLTLAY